MNLMQKYLERAAKELGICIEIGRKITLSDGRALTPQALFPDLGSELGTLVFRWEDDLDAETRHELVSKGYGVSTFSEPSSAEAFDVNNYAEIFSEWGWVGASNMKPKWMT